VVWSGDPDALFDGTASIPTPCGRPGNVIAAPVPLVPPPPGVIPGTFTLQRRWSPAWYAALLYLTTDAAQPGAVGVFTDITEHPEWDLWMKSVFDASGNTSYAEWWLVDNVAVKRWGDESIAETVAGGFANGVEFAEEFVKVVGLTKLAAWLLRAMFEYRPPATVPSFLPSLAPPGLLSAINHLPDSTLALLPVGPEGQVDFFDALWFRLTRDLIFIRFQHAPPSNPWAGWNLGRHLYLDGDFVRQMLHFDSVKMGTDAPANANCSSGRVRGLLRKWATLAGVIAHEAGHGTWEWAFGGPSGIDDQWAGPDFRATYRINEQGLAVIPERPFEALGAFSRHWVLEWAAAAVRGLIQAGYLQPGLSADQVAVARSLSDSVVFELDLLHARACDACEPAGYGPRQNGACATTRDCP
jgi:hypothetical protein